MWLVATVAVMFALPFAVARFASECSGMALCMMLFFIVLYIPSYLDTVAAGISGGCGIFLWCHLWHFSRGHGCSLISGKCGLSFMPRSI